MSFLYVLQSVRHGEGLTRDIGHGVQLVPHLVRDKDGLLLHVHVGGRVALLCRVPNERLDILLVQAVREVKEIFARWKPALGDLVREVAHKLWHLLHVRPHVLHGELVIVGHCHELDFTQGHQLLFFREHHAQEVCDIR